MSQATSCRRARRHSVACVLALTALWPFAGGAQNGRVEPGDRIRFSLGPSRVLHEARLEQLTADSLIVERCPSCAQLRYARREVGDLAVFRRKPAGMRALRGFGVGGLIGLVAGGIGGLTCHGTADKCEGWFVAFPFFGLIGGAIGAIAGYLGAYTWQPIGAA